MAQSIVEYPESIDAEQVQKVLLRVLHVDDETSFLKAAKQILEMQGAFQVDTASSVGEAKEKMKNEVYDAIVCDYIMPRKDGLQFLKELRDSGNNIPFVIFTGKGREEVAVQALNLGADRYFSKIGGPETVYGELAHGIRKAVKERKAQNEIWQREDRLKAILASSPDAIIISDLNANVVDCNQATLKLTGHASKEEIIGKNSLEFIAEKDRNRALENLKKTLEQGTVSNIEYTLLKKDEEEYQGELSASVLKDSSGNSIGFVGVVRDVTERKRAEEELRESEEKLRNIFQSANDCIFYLDKSGRIVDVNRKAVQLFGRSRKELFGRHFAKVGAISPKDLPTVMKAFAQSLVGKQRTLSVCINDKKGQGIPLECSASLAKADGKITGMLVIARAVTERKKAEEALRESQEKLNAMLQSIGDHMSMMDKDLNILWANEIAKRIFGDDIIGKKCYEAYHGRKKPCEPYPCLTLKAFQDGKVHEHDTQVVDKDGKIICFHCTANVALRDKEGKPTAVIEISRNITDRKKTEDALRNSENKYRTLLENLPQKIFLKDKNSVYIACNENYARDLKIKPDEIAGKTDYDFYPKKLAEKYRADDRRLMESGKTEDIEEEYIQDGQRVFVHTVKTPVRNENDDVIGILGIFWDITKGKQMREALTLSEEKFRNIFEGASDCLIYLDRSGRILNVNRKAVAVFGGSKEELLGKHFTKVGIFSLRDIPTLMSNFAKLLASKRAFVNIRIKNKKGQEIPLECSGSAMKIDGKPAGLMIIARDITERKKTKQELRDAREKWVSLMENTDDVIMIIDGKGTIQYLNPTPLAPNPREAIGKSVYEYVPKEQHDKMRESLRKAFKTGKPDSYEVSPNIQGIGTIWFSTKVVPIKHDGKTASVILISTDITERYKAEQTLRENREKLAVINEKLGVVGKLARHDARNKLSTVTMNVFLAKQKLPSDHEVLKHLNEVEMACEQVERIFDFARIYEKIGMEELAYINVEKTLGEAVMLFSDLHGVKVVNQCRGLTVLADSLLRQLFYNLIDNSLKHGEKVNQIKVYCKKVRKDQLKLIYEDNGVGIPKAEKEKIFIEGHGKGTGYGLYLIRKMCEVYGWTIEETGKHGRGAQFTITMPKVGESGKTNYRID